MTAISRLDSTPMLKCERVVVGPFEANCWVLAGADDEAIVIDPGADSETIRRCLVSRKLHVAAYICTHGHMDHVSALADMQRRCPAPAAMHPEDARWAFTSANSMGSDYPRPDVATIERPIREGSTFTDAGITWTVLETPGHTPGGVCIHIADSRMLFTGDTLFAGSVGRTDLPGGNGRVLSVSLKRLAGLPDKTTVCPGHGPETTIGEEKRSNYFLRAPLPQNERNTP